MKVSSTLSLFRANRRTFPMLESTKHLVKAGFEALDMNLQHFKFEENWKEDIYCSLEYAIKHGVEFLYGHLPYNFPKDFTSENKKEFDNRFYKAIDAAAFAGLKYAVMHAYTIPIPLDEYDEETEQRKAVEMLSPYYDYADKLNCEIVIENMRNPLPGQRVKRYLSDFDELIRLCDVLGNRGICLDTGHAHTVGEDTEDNIASLGSKLKMLHINDNFAAGDDHLPPFYGTIDWISVMHGIRKAGYTGTLNYEVTSPRIPAELRSQLESYLIDAGRILIGYYDE